MLGFREEPRQITYIPIFGLSVRPQSEKFGEIKLCDGLSFLQLSTVEHDLLRIEAGTYKEALGPPGLQNILPSVALKVDLPVGKRNEDSLKAIGAAIEYFRVMMIAFFNANIGMPLQFTGHKTPWHPFSYFTGRHPRELPEGHGHWTLEDHELRIFMKFWPMLYPKRLKRYHITANRLARSDVWKDLKTFSDDGGTR